MSSWLPKSEVRARRAESDHLCFVIRRLMDRLLRRHLATTPLEHDLDLVGTVMLKRTFEFRVVVPLRNQICYMVVPAVCCLDEVVHCRLEVIARGIDAPYQNLVT